MSGAHLEDEVRDRVAGARTYRACIGLRQSEGLAFRDNPALWRGHLRNVLPARSKLSIRHQPAMPYQDIPSFMSRLEGSQAVAARALQFLVLTAGRSGEVYGARWTEIDEDRAIWVIPPERMKAGKEHRVPLSKQALSIVSQQRSFREYRVLSFLAKGRTGICHHPPWR